MAAGEGPIQAVGVGGIYKIHIQTPLTGDDFTLCANWLSSVIATTLGHTRIYLRYAPEKSDIDAGTEFVTIFWKRADPDQYTQGPAAQRVSVHYWEVLSWKQGRTYAGIVTSAALLTSALDVAQTTTADGTILGAARDSFLATAAV